MRNIVILNIQWRAYRLPFVGYLSPRQDSRFIAPKADAYRPEPFASLEGKLREGSGSMGGEILRCAQDDSGKIPLNSFAPFATAHGVMAVREGAIVEVITEQGISGIGEIAPLPEFGRGNLSDALTALPTLAAHLRGKTLAEALDLLHTAVMERYLSPLSPLSPMSPMSPLSPCSKNLPVKAPRDVLDKSAPYSLPAPQAGLLLDKSGVYG
jgi:hypothetical protein